MNRNRHHSPEPADSSAVHEAGALLAAASETVILRQREAAADWPRVPDLEMIAPLGEGGMAQVWLALDTRRDQPLAVKLLRTGAALAQNAPLLAREIAILAGLDHPNLVRFIHAVTADDGRPGFCMEWVDGPTFEGWRKTHADARLNDKLRLFTGVVEGVAFLHEHGIIHRDLKPANLLAEHRRVAARNEDNLRIAHAFANFTLRKMRGEMRAAGRAGTITEDAAEAPASVGSGSFALPPPDPEPLPVNADGTLDLRYHRALLADLRAAAAESRGQPGAALPPIQTALNLYTALAAEAPDNPRRWLDAAQARLSFARLLARTGRRDGCAGQASRTLALLDRVSATRSEFLPADQAVPIRCDALRLLARQAALAGKTTEAVNRSREMLEACLALPSAGRSFPAGEPLPRLALAAQDLGRNSAARPADTSGDLNSNPNSNPAVTSRVPSAAAVPLLQNAVAQARADLADKPESASARRGQALCLESEMRAQHAADPAADLCADAGEVVAQLGALPDSAITAADTRAQAETFLRFTVDWAASLNPDPDPGPLEKAVSLLRPLITRCRQTGDDAPELLIMRGHLDLLTCRTSLQRGDRPRAGHFVEMALSNLRPRQARNPENLPLALLTAEALQLDFGLADTPAAHWSPERDRQLIQLMQQLEARAASLQPEEKRVLERIRASAASASPAAGTGANAGQ